MATTMAIPAEAVWDLPPLILHPFNEHVPPSALLENSRAALILSGLAPDEGADREELRRRLAAGRYAEIRMLFFIGKDVHRWVDQCLDSLERSPNPVPEGLTRQSFAALLTTSPPETVKQKLIRWGVSDYPSIFSRAIGLNALFTTPPGLADLSAEFLRAYHRYADALYRCYTEEDSYLPISAKNFRFDLYASGEYTKLLESQWE
jgi:hypothetical protein